MNDYFKHGPMISVSNYRINSIGYIDDNLYHIVNY